MTNSKFFIPDSTNNKYGKDKSIIVGVSLGKKRVLTLIKINVTKVSGNV